MTNSLYLRGRVVLRSARLIGLVRRSSLSLVIGGLVLGVALNLYISLFFVDKILLDWVVSIIFLFTAVIVQFLIFEYMKGSKELGIGTKVRLTFLGMSGVSFGYALLDLCDFLYGTGIPFVSFLMSIVLGGMLSVLERFIDLLEKNEL